MSQDLRIRLGDTRWAEVRFPPGTLALEVVAALSTAGRLGDGPFWLVQGGQSIRPQENVPPGGPEISLAPAGLLKPKLEELPREAVQVGAITVQFSGAPAAPRAAPAPANPADDFGIRIVSRKDASGSVAPPPGPTGGVTIRPEELEPRPGPSCVGCGGSISTADDACRACGTKVRGSTFREEVPGPASGQHTLPKICCCCLGSAERVESEKKLAEMRGNVRHYLHVSMPWCNACWSTHVWSERLGMVFFGIALVLGVAAGYFLDKAGMNGWVVFLGGLGVVIGTTFGFSAIENSREGANLPGHSRYCRGFIGVNSDYKQPPTYRFVFANRQFARQWQALNPR